MYKGIVDSVVRILPLPSKSEDIDILSHIDGPVTVQCNIVVKGSEHSISVFAERT